ncbi:chaplin family protein [Streptomyces lavendofoliae]|uniref:chaplin family protein n=1 Tax=Streptomyces lavendofoliae TaxID=67314 RepID=UPI003D91E6C8
MTLRRATAVTGLIGAAVGGSIAGAAPASAGGIGDFLSPAFGTSCLNQRVGAHATGETRHSAGSAGGNLAGVPIGSPFNQCGGADAPLPPMPLGGSSMANANAMSVFGPSTSMLMGMSAFR